MTREPGRTGRPTKDPTPGTRASLGLKVTGDIKAKLDAAARANGRTQSQEAEARLEQTFREELLLPQILDAAYGRETAGLVLALAECIRGAAQRAAMLCDGSHQKWHDDPSIETVGLWLSQEWMCYPWAFRQVVDAVWTVLDRLAPRGFLKAEPPEVIKAMPGTLRGPFEHAGVSVAGHVIAALRSQHAPKAGLARATLAPARERLKHYIQSAIEAAEQTNDGR
jgi:hypothetical protein